VAVGADGKVLAADSNQATKLKYVNVAGESFHGVVRSHPDSDSVNTKIRADLSAATMNDGHVYTPGQGLVFDKAVTGSIGGMQAAAVNDTWNKLFYARKRSDGSEGLWGLRAKNYLNDTSFTTAPDINRNLRLLTGTPTDKIAQGFQLATAGKVEFVDVNLVRAGVVSGNYWLTIEADSAGNPSGTPLATSDKYDASRVATTNGYIRIPFRTPATLTATTPYHLVLQADYAKSDTVFIEWGGVIAGGYANGVSKDYNGATWSATPGGSGLDRNFKLYVTQNDTALALPSGYDQYVQIGWFYINGSGNIVPFRSLDRAITTLAGGVDWRVSGAEVVPSTSPLLVNSPQTFPPASITATFDADGNGVNNLFTLFIEPQGTTGVPAGAGGKGVLASMWGTSSLGDGTYNSFMNGDVPVDFQAINIVTSTSYTQDLRVRGIKW
jgi:hypothetical protein